jgi:hypothetical protein
MSFYHQRLEVRSFLYMLMRRKSWQRRVRVEHSRSTTWERYTMTGLSTSYLSPSSSVPSRTLIYTLWVVEMSITTIKLSNTNTRENYLWWKLKIITIILIYLGEITILINPDCNPYLRYLVMFSSISIMNPAVAFSKHEILDWGFVLYIHSYIIY